MKQVLVRRGSLEPASLYPFLVDMVAKATDARPSAYALSSGRGLRPVAILFCLIRANAALGSPELLPLGYSQTIGG